MFRKIFILIVFALTPVISQQQHAAENYEQWYKDANTNYELETPTAFTDSLAVLNFLKTVSAVKNKPALRNILLDCYIKIGNIYQGQQRFAEAMMYYHLVLKQAAQKKHTLFQYQANLYMGSARYSLNEIDSATYFLENAYSFVKGQKELPDLTVLYNSLGIIYFESANFGQAINYFQLAIDELKPSDNSYNESLVSFKNNIAACYGKLNNHEQSLRTYLSLLKYKELSESLLQNVGHAYYQLGKYDSALLYLNKVPFSKTSFHVKLINEKARIYMQKGLLSDAERLFDSAIAVNKQLPGNLKNKDKAYSYLYRSQLAYKQGLLNEAVTWSNIALQELHFNFWHTKEEELPPNVTDVISPVVFFEVLKHKAFLLQKKFEQTGNQLFLSQALETWLLAAKTSGYIKDNFDNDEAALFFNESNGSVYKQAALAAAWLYKKTGNESYKQKYLLIVENFKGNIVYRNLLSTTAKDKGLLPDSLIRREKELKQLLAVFTTRLNNLASAEAAVLVQKKITELQIELSRLQKSFEQYPQYKRAQNPHTADSISISNIQKQLNTNTSAIQYLWCDSVLLCLTITSSASQLHLIKIDKNNDDALKTFISCLYNTPEGLRFSGHELSEKVYRFLTSEWDEDVKEKKQWVVLPDGALNYLPFETLATNAEERKWLVLQKAISYHYSFSLLLNDQKETNAAGSFFAAAPFADSEIKMNDVQLDALPYSAREIEPLPGIKLQNEAATKQIFLNAGRNCSFIHLATHAFAGSEDKHPSKTFIQFYHRKGSAAENSRLYLNEIYNLAFTNHPLIVLSACETAAGNTTGGEGLLSLSRGFLYAGAGGIVSTLWKAEDKVTAYIMNRFYLYLKAGDAAEPALQKARIDFLNDEGVDVRYKTPNYWGHFVYIGKPGKELIAEPSIKNWFSVFIVALSLCFAAFLFTRIEKSQKVSEN